MFSIWSAVEINVAIFCSCAPTLKGLVQRVWPQFLASLGSRYASRGSRGNSGREDSGATAVNSTTSTSSNEYLRKPKDDAQAECQSAPKSSHGLLGFRRSLFKPFFSGNNNSCYGSKSHDDDIMFDEVTRTSTRKGSATTSKVYHEEKGIEVQTVVDQWAEPMDVPVAEEHRTIVGAGDNVKDPFDDDQEERDIQRAAWSSS